MTGAISRRLRPSYFHFRSYSYDGVGNVRSRVDRNSRLTQWDYDKLYRVSTETWRATSSPSSTVLRTHGYVYDSADRLIEVSDSDASAIDFGFIYDARGQLQIELQVNSFLNSTYSLIAIMTQWVTRRSLRRISAAGSAVA